MAGEITAADGALKAGADAIGQSRAELKGELSKLEGKLGEIGAKWQGQGAVAFNQLMVRWRDDATKIVEALNEFEANLVDSQKTYTAADDSEASTFAKLNRF